MSGSEMKLKPRFLESLSAISDKEVAVCLSGGVDSRAILYGLLEIGKTAHAYTFAFKNHLSKDFYISKAIAAKEGVEFTPVFLPEGLDVLWGDIHRLHDEFKCERKTEYECTWPFLYVYPALDETWIATGLGAEGHFVLSKKAVLHYKDRPDEFRDEYWTRENPNQRKQHSLLCRKFGKHMISPFLEKKTADLFRGKAWDEINRPKQKQAIIDMFPDKYASAVVNPANLQIGSGIRDHFDKLLLTKLNKGHKSITGVLNEVNKGIV